MLSENFDPSIVFDPRDEESSRLGNLLKPVQIIVALVEGVDAARHNDNILLRRPNIGHFAVAQSHKARDVAGEIKFRVEFNRALVFPIMRPVVLSQAQINGRAVDCVKRIVKFETVSRSTCQSPVEDFLEKRLENIRAAPVHGVCESGFCYGSHAQVVEAVVIGRQTADNFTQRIFAGNLSIETGQELLPCGKILAITVAGQVFYGFFKTISGNELEKLLKDAIVIHCRISYAQFKSDLLRSI